MMKLRTTTQRVIAGVGAAGLVLAAVIAISGGDETATKASDPVAGAASPSSGATAGTTAKTPKAKTPTAPKAKGKPVPAPTPGNLKPVTVEPVKVKDPVPLTAVADFGTGITLRVVKVEAVKGRAKGPGQIAGPALRVTMKAKNDSKSNVPLTGSVVDVSYGKRRTPGISLRGPGAKPFPKIVKAGSTATGTYVFNVPTKQRNRVQVTMSYSAKAPTVVFEGTAK